MPTNIFNWTKNNKFATFVIFVLALVVIFNGKYTNTPFVISGESQYQADSFAAGGGGAPANMMVQKRPEGYPYEQATPNLNITDRKVITGATLSLQVKSVQETVTAIKTKTSELGGYIVNIYIERPEFGENANLSVRVPSDDVTEFLSFARASSLKVVNENISGSDITDQYVDLETRLAQLLVQKAKLEAILNSAVTVQEIMSVQPYITQIQYEIDGVKGQTNYIDGATKSSLITMYLSTDELSLPYTPEKSWRPQVVFKNAVRSLLAHVQTAGTALIWLGVYSVIIAPAAAIVLIIYLLRKRRQ